jgi:hypothetical protein
MSLETQALDGIDDPAYVLGGGRGVHYDQHRGLSFVTE